MSEFIEVAKIDDLKDGMMKKVSTGGRGLPDGHL